MVMLLFWFFAGFLILAGALFFQGLSMAGRRESDYDFASRGSSTERLVNWSAAILAFIGITGIVVLVFVYGF